MGLHTLEKRAKSLCVGGVVFSRAFFLFFPVADADADAHTLTHVRDRGGNGMADCLLYNAHHGLVVPPYLGKVY